MGKENRCGRDLHLLGVGGLGYYVMHLSVLLVRSVQ